MFVSFCGWWLVQLSLLLECQDDFLTTKIDLDLQVFNNNSIFSLSASSHHGNQSKKTGGAWI